MGAPTPPQADFPLDTYTLVLLRTGDRHAQFDADTVAELQAGHLKHMFGLQADGHLLAAGAVADDRADPPVIGFGFFRTDPQRTRDLLADDPALRAGLEAAEVVTFVCPQGALVFPQAVAG